MAEMADPRLLLLSLVLPPLKADEAYRAELFDAPKNGPPFWSAYTDLAKLARDLLVGGQRGNAYFSPVTFKAGGRRVEADALRCQAMWADLDVCRPGEKNHKPNHYGSLEQAIAAADQFTLKPHAVLLTGRGALPVWLLAQPVEGDELARLIRLVRGLARKLQGDPNVALATQLIRVPGTKNFDPKRKKDGKTYPVRLHCIDPELARYTLDDFAKAGVAEIEAKSKQHSAQMDLPMGEGKVVENPRLSARMKALLATPGQENYPSASEADAAVLTALLGVGLSPEDAVATFRASPRGVDAAQRKEGHLEDYIERTLRSAQGTVDEDRARAREHIEAVAAASSNGNGPSRQAPLTTFPFPEGAWHGIFSVYRDAVATTEAPPQHHFATLCGIAGALFGRTVYAYYERPTYPNHFIVLVGKTGAVRKTGTMRRGTDSLRRIDPTLTMQTGLGSAEGLAEALAMAEMTPAERKRYEAHVTGEIDKQTGELPPVPLPPTRGRRLLVVLEEFATTLGKARMEGTGNLLPLITQLYDCPPQIDHPLRSKSIVALSPTLNILTASAPAWIERYLQPTELLSGFANRFEYWPGDPGEPIPWPEPPRAAPLNAVIEQLRGALDYWSQSRQQVEFGLSSEAKRTWAAHYAVLHSRFASYDDQAAASVQRVPAFTIKMALTFAALECGEPTISSEHLERAIVVADYLEVCATELLGGLGMTEDVKLQQKILQRLAQEPSKRRNVQQALSGRIGGPMFKRVWDSLVDGKIIVSDRGGAWHVVGDEE